MGLIRRVILTILFVVLTTVILFHVKNRSNFPSKIAIPVIVSLLTKYVIGDWDSGFRWTTLDIPYWLCILAVSYGTVILIENK